ncbi:sensor histidine kinase [Paenibacillus woosongensis]|uniref:histidine kinase n=1 Tax=Paenibacillus woosongensis TaxID=307580 RepID=A0ABQ4MKZ0_9BACL|nr:HAMP domain-containing sensor histidine kinase [Paenibacillus woosongensis]GIP56648.1 sensor histidine kinase [Paenibacillus woosongensis]
MGIRKRLVGSYLLVILTTVITLEAILIAAVNYYYYHNIERTLVTQAELSASFYEQYFAEEDLEQQAERLLGGFSHHFAGQVQIIGSSGQLIQDTSGFRLGQNMTGFPDVRSAIAGFADTWRGQDLAWQEEVLAVSYPLVAKGQTAGAVRFITSLKQTKEAVRQIALIFIAVGLLVIAIVAAVGIVLSGTITKSITGLKRAAEKMADGDFSVRAEKPYKDELGALADTLNTMAGTIQRQEQLKNDFISSVSHELRTPLTSIKGWVVTLRANLWKGKVTLEEGLDIIESETDRLTELVDELLDFSKFGDGRMELSRSSLHLGEFLTNIGQQLRPRAARQGIELEVKVTEPLPVISADPNRLKQVMINLLDNALKFTGSGGSIVISASLAEGQVIIAVEDTGSGIPEQDLRKLPQKFYKGNHKMSGSGLGLSISEQIIQLHQGQLQIDSELGKGTKVTVYLPSGDAK